jgi:hypothetical protein
MMQGEIVGGFILNLKKVAHCQYVSKFGSEETGSLDFLFDYLLQKSLQESAILILVFRTLTRQKN